MSASTPKQALPITELQTEVATALRNFYKFLGTLPWLDSSEILEPPEQGWPNITSERFAKFHMNDKAVELLKHIPYLRMDGPGQEYNIAFSTWPCDYRRDYFRDTGPSGATCSWELPDTTEAEFTFPEWVVPLTYGKVNGQYIMLDTTDGK
jgi:hypothetical protein